MGLAVLLVEPDERVLRVYGDRLVSDGYEIEVGSGRRRASERLSGFRPDVLVLCRKVWWAMLLLRELRAGKIDGADPRLPVLLVGADEESEVVRCLEAGVDRTVPSEASTLWVAAELRALVRCRRARYRGELRVGNMTIYRQGRTVRVGERLVTLTRTEFAVLEALAVAPGNAVEYAELGERVWGHPVTAMCAQRHVTSLRRTLAEAGASVVVKTVYGVGLQLVIKPNIRKP